MKYKLYKAVDDGRLYTASIVLPDGFYRIMQLTRDNHKNLETAVAQRGYIVEELPDNDKRKCGIYSEWDDKRCTEASVKSAFEVHGGGMDRVEFLADKDPVDDATERLGWSKARIRESKGIRGARRRGGQEVRTGNTVEDLSKALGAMGIGFERGTNKQDMERLLEQAIAGR